MTRDQFVKVKWEAYMTILYKDKGMQHAAECLLSAVDWDNELLTLTPINDFYEMREFQGHISFCELKKDIRVVGKKKPFPENTLKAKKLGDIDPETYLDDAS